MRIQLLGKNKLGIVGGTLRKEDFRADLGHQLDQCNAIVQGWIIISVTQELHTGIVMLLVHKLFGRIYVNDLIT